MSEEANESTESVNIRSDNRPYGEPGFIDFKLLVEPGRRRNHDKKTLLLNSDWEEKA